MQSKTPEQGRGLRSPWPATGVSRAFRAEVSPTPKVGGMFEGVSDGVCECEGVSGAVSPRPFGPRPPECPKSVLRVSRSVRHTNFDTPGHSRDTFWTLRSLGPEGPRAPPRWTLLRTPPVFGDTLGDTPGTLRARKTLETPVAGRGLRKSRKVVQNRARARAKSGEVVPSQGKFPHEMGLIAQGCFAGFNICQKHASDPRPPHTRQKYEQKSGQNMTLNASKQGKFDSLGPMFLFIFLPCMWGLGFQNESPIWGYFPDLVFSSLSVDSNKSTCEEQSRKGPRNNQDLSRKKDGKP